MKLFAITRMVVALAGAALMCWSVPCWGDPLSRTNWFNSGGTMTTSPGHLVITPGGVSNYFATTYFAPTNAPLALSRPGSQIKLTWAFTPTGVQAITTQTPLAIGLINTADTNRLAADGAPAAGYYSGFASFMNAYVGNPLFAWLRLASWTDPAAPANTAFTGDQPQYGGWTPQNDGVNYSGSTNGIPYTYTMTLTRNSANGLAISAAIKNNIGFENDASYLDASPNTFSFNTGVIYGFNQLAGTFDTTAFNVDFNYGSSAVVRDTWFGGDRTSPAPPVYSEQGTAADTNGDIASAWFNSSNSSSMVATPGHLTTTITNGETYWTTYFTTPTNPITLANAGDRIHVTWAFTPSNVHGGSTETPLRFALVNSQATNRLTADGVPPAAAYPGYAAFMGVGNDVLFWILELGGRADTNAVLPLFQAGYFNQLAGWTGLGENINYQAGANGLPYVFEMSLTRNAAGGMDLESSVSGQSGVVNEVSATDPNPNTYTFDAASIYGEGTVSGTYDTTLFQVDYFPVPAIQAVKMSHGNVQFTWNARSNLTYQVQYNTDLTQTNWNNWGAPVTASNSLASVSAAIDSGPQKFYRVVFLP